MENKNIQNTPGQQTPRFVTPAHHEKIIQPSPELIEEMKTQQNSAALEQAGQPTFPSTQPPSQPASSITSQRPMVPAQSIYPEPTMGINAMPAVAESATNAEYNEQATDAKSSQKLALIRIVTGFLLILDLVNAYTWYLERHAGYTSWLDAISIVLYFVLSISIFKLKEAARQAYVFLAIILLIPTAISLVMYLSQSHKTDETLSKGASQSVISLEASLKDLPTNTSLTAAEKKILREQDVKEIKQLSGYTSSYPNAKQYISDAILVAEAIGPLIFFTRPTIKEVFI